MEKLPYVPGRGLVTETSTQLRLEYLKSLEIDTDEIEKSNLCFQDIRNKIESYIGSTEVPLGLVGPLLFNDSEKPEYVYTSVGTLEGALVASMNRGCKAISKSGGFTAQVNLQVMSRVPMLLFEKEIHGLLLIEYIDSEFLKIKKLAESYSNHVVLLGIEPIQMGKAVHLRFNYTTGDASGQNMTTICTWHVLMFIIDQLKKDKNIIPEQYVIEGNGSADKKVSYFNIDKGRGINVTAKCFLNEDTIKKTLRTSSKSLMSSYLPSVELAKKTGMVGYNINVANAVAGIFVATGQDLGSLHESSVAKLTLTPYENGLEFNLNLSNLVIGTVGGGVGLPKQSQILKMMECYGNGKVERFAKLIAGFALGLEISTFSAIVSGEFAKSHEKLGRNKPVNWLLKSEVSEHFVRKCFKGYFDDKLAEQIVIEHDKNLENGILTNITSRVSKKLIGFIPVSLQVKNKTKKVLLKSKPTDKEVIKGLHMLAASIDPKLSDLIRKNAPNLEYKNTHLKEIDIYKYLSESNYQYAPTFYGYHLNKKREIYCFIQEFFENKDLKIKNSEDNPEQWNSETILNVISAISSFHQAVDVSKFKNIQEFSAISSKDLYKKLLNLIIEDKAGRNGTNEQLKILLHDIDNLEKENIGIAKTVIHNDFNPRNIFIKNNGQPIFYDWELTVIDFPHRDIVEFLSFVLDEDFKKEELLYYLKFHFNLYENENWADWLQAYIYSLKVFLISRVSFYEAMGILIKYDFSERVLKVALKMLEVLKSV